MKRISSLAFILTITVSVFGQVQPGKVRTIGRADKPGQPVSGVMIKSDGPSNMVLSGADGTFQLTFDGLKEGDAYRLTMIKKSSYRLLDAGMIGRPFGISSSVPVEICLVNEAQLAAEKAAIAEKLEAQITAKYMERIQELEAQNLTLEQKQKEQQSLDKNYEKLLQQLDEQSEYYATRDYDRMDSLDRVITGLIEQGEFDKAEALIHSKGSIEERLAALQKLQSDAQLSQELATKAQQLADAQKEAAAKEKRSLEQDLVNLFQMAKNSYQNDTAYYYIRKLVELSPDNTDYLDLAGEFANRGVGRYRESLEYYQKSLDLKLKTYGEEHEKVVRAYMLVGNAYQILAQFDKALEYIQKALDTQLKLSGEENYYVAHCYSSMALIYANYFQFDIALEYALKSHNIRVKLYGEDNVEVMNSFRNLGNYYLTLNQPEQAEKCYQKASDILSKLPGEHEKEKAENYMGFAKLYLSMERYDKALEYYPKAIDLYTKMYGPEDLHLAIIYSHLCLIYTNLEQYDTALEYIQKAFDIRQKKTPNHPWLTQYNQQAAECYIKMGQLDKAIEKMEETAPLLRKTKADMEYLDLLGSLLHKVGRDEEALQVWQRIHTTKPDFPQNDWAKEVESKTND